MRRSDVPDVGFACRSHSRRHADIDAFYGADLAASEAARQIARRRGWPEDWLNDRVDQFRSHFEQPDDWMELQVREGVVIRVASGRLLLAMKLRAARGRRDSADIDVLLDVCEITTVNDAVGLFEQYYPEEGLNDRALAQLQARFGPQVG